MSCGLVICSECRREVHQDGPDQTWRHCQDKTPRCDGAVSRYPSSRAEIVGPFCGADDLDGSVLKNLQRKRRG